MAVVAPSGTPTEIVQRMNGELDDVLKQAEIVQRLQKIGFYTTGAGTTRETGGFIRAQYRAWGNVIREIGVQPE
jgi:tripartite-type tricarboxylate transporter receptor subunit TctC